MTTSPARHPLAPAFPVMGAVFVGYLVVGMALPVLPLHVHDDLGFGPFVVGLVSGGQFLAALVSRLWAGHLADMRGSRHAVLAGLAAAMAGGGCYLLSLLFTPQPMVAVGIILVGRILLGGAESLVITGGISWALALLPPQMAGKAIAWVGMAMFAAMAAGSPLGDLVYRHTGFGGIAGSALLLPALAAMLVCSTLTGVSKRSSVFIFTGMHVRVGKPEIMTHSSIAAKHCNWSTKRDKVECPDHPCREEFPARKRRPGTRPLCAPSDAG